MIDPDLKYCPRCEDEYRADIEQCANCGIPLITGRELLARMERRRQRLARRAGPLTPEDDIVTIQGGPLDEMRRLEELLTREKIGTLIGGDDNSCGKGCCPSTFYLQVRREDAPDALTILEAEHQRLTGLDGHDLSNVDAVFNADAGEAVCPACGHSFATTATTCPDCGLCFG